jgi:hypothetical protein
MPHSGIVAEQESHPTEMVLPFRETVHDMPLLWTLPFQYTGVAASTP